MSHPDSDRCVGDNIAIGVEALHLELDFLSTIILEDLI